MSVPELPAGAILDASAGAPHTTIDALAPGGSLLIVAPHPDDETFGCGMALAAAAAKRRRIAIVLLTDGEGSHPNARTITPEELAVLRFGEFEAALAVLVPSQEIDVLRLRQPDGRTRYDPALLEKVIPFARERNVSAVWSTWQDDPHCDHETAALLGRAVAHACAIPFWQFAVWGRFGEGAVPSGLSIFDDPQTKTLKREAIAAYKSQIDPKAIDDPHGFVMPPALVSHFADHPEVFISG
ncbi:PIG-L deacetylase family protein [Qipengyuania atrilutea]|uniref:PIG-L family deacetylase n=1 Tax=Qipengyuania atrilutea TaxID=2744473 RepID=A0A850H3Z3_9SPHN|nr:PIG-L family deacetylase [Actirhodobacter atriluteus]NVD45310.1 PIG-L family deacetylase [Actirhodobacter atriluteus]